MMFARLVLPREYKKHQAARDRRPVEDRVRATALGL